MGALRSQQKRVRAVIGWQGSTYSVKSGDGGEVLEGLQSADVEADHFELGELLQVLLVVLCQALNLRLVQDEVVELPA